MGRSVVSDQGRDAAASWCAVAAEGEGWAAIRPPARRPALARAATPKILAHAIVDSDSLMLILLITLSHFGLGNFASEGQKGEGQKQKAVGGEEGPQSSPWIS